MEAVRTGKDLFPVAPVRKLAGRATGALAILLSSGMHE